MRGDKYFKIIPSVSSLCPPTCPSFLFPPSRRWKSRKEDDSFPRESHDNNAGGKVPERTTKSRRAGERNGEKTDCEDAPSGQSGAGSRNIFENSNHLLETTDSARRRRQRHVNVDTEVKERRRSGEAGPQAEAEEVDRERER